MQGVRLACTNNDFVKPMKASTKKPTAGKSVRVNLPVDVLVMARALKLNLSNELVTHLRLVIREKQSEQWRVENREAILATNREVGREGHWSDGLRMF